MGYGAGNRARVECLESRVLLSGVLAADINPLPSRTRVPFGLTRVGDTTYFGQHDGVNGAELWKTDGTEAGTVMIKDIFPGLGSGAPSGYVATSDGTVFFVATDGVRGYELWKTDGTEAGTVLVKDIWTGPSNSIPSSLTPVGNRVYFFANDGVHGNELWVSDGTDAGTHLVKDLLPGGNGQTPQGLGVTNGKLLFYGTDGTTPGLWSSTGVVGDATLLKSRLYASQLTSFDNRCYFTDEGGLVWTSDGTVGGTFMVQNINSAVTQFVSTGDALYFNRTSIKGRGVYRILAGGTTVTSVGTGFSNPNTLANVDGTLFFTDTRATGAMLYEVTKWDESAYPVADVAPGVRGAYVENLVGVGPSAYFTLYTAAEGFSLWRVPDWTSQPEYVAPLNSGPGLYAPLFFASAGSRLVFVSDDLNTGLELWSSDGTAWGTGMIRDTCPSTADSNTFFGGRLGDRLIFYANDGVSGSEPMALDASGNLTVLGDLEPGKGSSYPYGTAVVGDRLVLAATTTGTGRELWVTDGTAGGTAPLKDINAGPGSSDPGIFIAFKGKVFFSAQDASHGREIWVTDGTSAGTSLFKDILPGTGSGGFGEPVVMDGVLYFVAADAAGSELWRSDGTVGGTVRVKDVYAGSSGSAPAGLSVCNGVLYFSASDSAHGTELWRSDGTDGGTRLVKDIKAGGGSGVPSGMTPAGAYLYFTATDATGKGAWRTDGTEAGTIRLSTTALSPYGFTELNGSAYFFAGNSAGGWDLWRSDGTVAGTAMVAPMTPPPASYTPPSPNAMTAVNGRLFFFADDGVSGRELWSSDGTAAGTALVQDLAPGTLDGVSPSQLVALDGDVYVVGDNTVSGSEPWRFADEYAPVVWKQGVDAKGTLGFTIGFNEAINPPSAFDTVVTNTSTGQSIPPDQTNLAYDPVAHVLRLSFTGFANGTPPDGNYRVSFGAGTVADLAGNAVQSSLEFDFFFLGGDANQDRTVDFNDLVKLAQNYNSSGKSFEEGDFNFDGTVDFNDLVILAQRYNTSLPAGGGVVAGAAVSPMALMPGVSGGVVADKKKKKKVAPPKVFKAPAAKPVVVKKVAAAVRSPFAKVRVR